MVGLPWVSSKIRCKAGACASGLAAFGLLFAQPAAAQGAHVQNRCARLTALGYEELDARVLLLLKGEKNVRELPAVICTSQGSWVEWEGRRFEILGRAPIADEVVDIVDGALHDDERRAEADPRAAENAAVASGRPMLERGAGAPPAPPAVTQPADRIARNPSKARGGGIAVGIETELPSSSIGVAVGPAFDFGANVGPLMLGGREAVRFTFGKERQVSFMDFQASVGYGAPFDPDRLWGVVARFGAEWMVAYPEGNSGQAAVVPTADLGFRLAYSFGLVSAWLGVDAHLRLATLELRSQSPLVANTVGGSATFGFALVDWSQK